MRAEPIQPNKNTTFSQIRNHKITDKKILINCLSARSGGATSYLQNAVSRILDFNNDRSNCCFFALCDSNQAELIGQSRKSVLLAPTTSLSGLRRSIWEKNNMRKIVDKHQFSTIFTPYQCSSAQTSAKSVLMLRNMEPFFFGQYQYAFSTKIRNHVLKHLTTRSMKNADHVIAVSDFAKEYLVNHIRIPSTSISQIYHGRDPFFSETGNSNELDATFKLLQISSPFLLTCGSLLPYRRGEDVIRAFSKYWSTADQRLRLVIAGDSNDCRYKNKLKRLAKNTICADHIHFVGHVNKTQIRMLYQQAKLVILATEIEACPNIAIEAMSAGAVIVASNSKPLPEIIGHNNARFYEKRNTDELSRLISNLLESKHEITTLRKQARQRANEYSWEYCAKKTADLLESI